MTMSPFLVFFAISLELVRCPESLRQSNHWFVTKRVFFDCFCYQLNVSFVNWDTLSIGIVLFPILLKNAINCMCLIKPLIREKRKIRCASFFTLH